MPPEQPDSSDPQKTLYPPPARAQGPFVPREGSTFVGRYLLKKQLGRGGMGSVWLACDLSSGLWPFGRTRPTAAPDTHENQPQQPRQKRSFKNWLRCLFGHFLGRPTEESGERLVALKFPSLEDPQGPAFAIKRLKREIKRAKPLAHANIVRIHDWIADPANVDSCAFSMEYVDGQTLDAWRRTRRGGFADPDDLLPIACQICDAIDYAHKSRHHIIHRDLKPGNIMLRKDGAVKVMDFGIAGEANRLTTTNARGAGTPRYMSPQQLKELPPAPTDDIYSLGFVLYELLAGAAPLPDGYENIDVRRRAVHRRNPAALRGRPSIPAHWDATLAACLDKDPDKRPQTARELWARLQNAPARVGLSQPSWIKKLATIGRSIAVLAVVFAGVYFATRAVDSSKTKRQPLSVDSPQTGIVVTATSDAIEKSLATGLTAISSTPVNPSGMVSSGTPVPSAGQKPVSATGISGVSPVRIFSGTKAPEKENPPVSQTRLDVVMSGVPRKTDLADYYICDVAITNVGNATANHVTVWPEGPGVASVLQPAGDIQIGKTRNASISIHADKPLTGQIKATVSADNAPAVFRQVSVSIEKSVELREIAASPPPVPPVPPPKPAPAASPPIVAPAGDGRNLSTAGAIAAPASATTPSSKETTTAPENAAIATTRLGIEVSARNNGLGDPNYTCTVKVTNAGDATAMRVTVSPAGPGISGDPVPLGNLAAGESKTAEVHGVIILSMPDGLRVNVTATADNAGPVSAQAGIAEQITTEQAIDRVAALVGVKAPVRETFEAPNNVPTATPVAPGPPPEPVPAPPAAILSAGNGHSLYVSSDGILWGMGQNEYGQLGDRATKGRLAPAQITSNVTTVAAGGEHSLYVTRDGKLWAMGWNKFGQLGDGTTTNRFAPVQIATAASVTAVAAGGNHSLYVTNDGKLWAMGDNAAGELGDGTTTERHSPVYVASDVIAVAAGYSHSLYITSDGTLWGIGMNARGQLGGGAATYSPDPAQIASDVIAVAAWGDHSLYVTRDGKLWVMGDNNNGESGDGTTITRRAPVQITTAINVTTVAAGLGHSLYITRDGTLWAMGWNLRGQLGNGTTTDSHTPVQVAADVITAAAGHGHSLYVTRDGKLWAMGTNTAGQLGDGTSTDRSRPVQCKFPRPAVSSGPAPAAAASAAGNQPPAGLAIVETGPDFIKLVWDALPAEWGVTYEVTRSGKSGKEQTKEAGIEITAIP